MLHCSSYLSWPLAAVVRSKPSHASSLRPHCFSFCLWRDAVLRRDGEGFIAVFPSPRLDCPAAVCGPDPPTVLGGRGASARRREQHRRGLAVRGRGSAPLSGWLAHQNSSFMSRKKRLRLLADGLMLLSSAACQMMVRCTAGGALLLDLANTNISYNFYLRWLVKCWRASWSLDCKIPFWSDVKSNQHTSLVFFLLWFWFLQRSMAHLV